MNIVELCLSPGSGGLEMYPPKVMRRLTSEGHVCHAAIARDTFLSRWLDEDSMSWSHLPVANRHAPFLAARKLAARLDDRKADILHVHWGKDLLLAVLAKILAQRDVKLVYTRQMALTRPKRDPYHRWIYSHVDRYVVITKQLQNEAWQYLPIDPEKVCLLYYGVPEAQPSAPGDCAVFLKDHGLDGPGIKVALFGRIARVKGQHLLVEAVEQLHARRCEVRAAMMGHIVYQDYFDEIMTQVEKNGLQENVHYLGFVENPASVMPCFDIVVLTTYAETFGLVIAEAQRAGIAVIGTDGGGVPEMIEHEVTGLLIDQGDATQLADAIERLAGDSALRTRLASAGKVFADREFSEDRHYQGLMEIFDSALAH